MKNETLLDIAIFNYRMALKNYRDMIGDERELNVVGYFLQQAAELCIKHHMEINGIKYNKTHIIEDLLDDAKDSVKFADEFYNFAPAITRWEARGRYIKNYVLEKKQIDKGMILVRDFLLENNVTEKDLKLAQIQLQDISVFEP
jgi:HEPN domain-containing protein